MDAAKGLFADEALEPFDAEGELAKCERPLPVQSAEAKAVEMIGQRIVRAVDDP